MDYMIVSFCTNDTQYINYGKRLNEYLSNYNLNYEIDFLDFHYKTKLENCFHKSQFILDKFIKHKTTLIWMDIDSILINNPTNYIDYLINSSFDVGLVYTPGRKHPVTDAIHIYQYTRQSLNFLKYRDIINKSGTLNLAHKSLDRSFEEYKNKIEIIDIRNEIKPWFTAVFSKDESILEY